MWVYAAKWQWGSIMSRWNQLEVQCYKYINIHQQSMFYLQTGWHVQLCETGGHTSRTTSRWDGCGFESPARGTCCVELACSFRVSKTCVRGQWRTPSCPSVCECERLYVCVPFIEALWWSGLLTRGSSCLFISLGDALVDAPEYWVQ